MAERRGTGAWYFAASIVAFVPEIVRNKTLAAGAAQWIRDLDGLVAGLERDGPIAVGP